MQHSYYTRLALGLGDGDNQMAIFSNIETVTPETASIILANNPNNRTVSKTKTNEYASLMAAGMWALNGQALIIDEDGALIDGQHRLHACMISGVPFQSLVVRGIPSTAKITIDRGRVRTIGDDISMAGIPYGNAIAACVSRLFQIATGNVGVNSPPAMTWDFVQRNPFIATAVKEGMKCKYGCGPGASALYFIAERRSLRHIGDKMITTLFTGEPAYHNDPFFVLRERSIAVAQKRQPLTRGMRMELEASAWDAFRNGEPRKNLKPKAFAHIEGWSLADMGGGFVNRVSLKVAA